MFNIILINKSTGNQIAKYNHNKLPQVGEKILFDNEVYSYVDGDIQWNANGDREPVKIFVTIVS